MRASTACLFCRRSVSIRKLVAVRSAVLDTFGPMATSCGDVVSAEALHLIMLRAARRALVHVEVGASQG